MGPSSADIQTVRDTLNLLIPVGHFLDYTLESDNTTPGAETFYLTVSVTQGKSFPLFAGGQSPGQIFGSLNWQGSILTIPH